MLCKITSFYKKTNSNKMILIKVINSLKFWLINHIKRINRKYAGFGAIRESINRNPSLNQTNHSTK